MSPNLLRTVALVFGLGVLVFLLSRGGGRTGDVADPPARPDTEPLGPAAELVSGRSEPSSIRSEAALDGAKEPAPRPQQTVRTPKPEEDSTHFRLKARVLTETDEPIAGAEVRAEDLMLATSADDGRIETDVVLPGNVRTRLFRSRVDVLVVAEGRLGVTLRPEIRSDTTVDLGTVRLAPGTEIEGEVVDPSGRGVRAAYVSYRHADEMPEDEERARDNGVAFRIPLPYRADTRTDSEGKFHLRGVLPEDGFLVASAQGYRHGWSPVLRLGAGVPANCRIVLEPDAAFLHPLLVRVVSPDGQELEQAKVAYKPLAIADAWSGILRDTTPISVWRESATTLLVQAHDPKERWSPARLEVESTEEEVAIVLQPPDWLELVVANPEGEPIPWSNASWTVDGEFGRDGHPLVALGEAGRRQILRPYGPFSVTAYGPGYASSNSGPHDPDAVGSSLVIQLSPGSAIRGRVEHEGEPIPQALVSLTRTSPPGPPADTADVTSREAPFQITGRSELGRRDATTNAKGDFTISLHSDGWFSVRVEATGWPLTVFGPFEWNRETPRAPIVLGLQPAGAIEGRLLVAPGQELEGCFVGVANGWDVLHTSTTDAGGSYRIERLAPGDYQVRLCVPPLAELQNIEPWWTPNKKGREIEWDCKVHAGETTTYDLDMTQEGAVRLNGTVRLGDEPAHNAAVQLHPYDASGLDYTRQATASSRVGVNGTYAMAVSRGGKYRLLVRVGSGNFVTDIELHPGENVWDLMHPAGSIRIRAPFEKRVLFRLHAQLPDGIAYEARLSPGWGGDRGEVAQDPVPTGSMRIETEILGGNEGLVLWKETQVQPGEETTLDYP